MKRRPIVRSVVLLAALATGLVACSGPERGSAAPQAAALRVQVHNAERRDLTRSITLPASVEAFEQARLYAKVSGYLAAITVDIGDRVQREQLVATLDIPEMQKEYAAADAHRAEMRAQLTKAEADLSLQKTLHERTRALRERKAVTQNDLDEAAGKYTVARAAVDLARAQVRRTEAELAKLEALMEYTRIKAPFDGVVTERFADPGALIQAATGNTNVTPVVTVARVDVVRTFVDIPEREVPFVSTQNRATLEPTALARHTFDGRVTRFARALSPATRTMRTEVDFGNPDGRLYPGMYGSLTIALETHPNAIVVPSIAVSRRKDGQAFVYIVAGSAAHQKLVHTGIDDGIQTEIVDGLEGNEPCIVSASGSLEDGTPVIASELPATSGGS